MPRPGFISWMRKAQTFKVLNYQRNGVEKVRIIPTEIGKDGNIRGINRKGQKIAIPAQYHVISHSREQLVFKDGRVMDRKTRQITKPK